MRGKRVGSPFQFSGKQMGFLFLLRKASCDGTPGTAGGKEPCCGLVSPGGPSLWCWETTEKAVMMPTAGALALTKFGRPPWE